jgi:UDP-N-acetylmuramate--alanine ligase
MNEMNYLTSCATSSAKSLANASIYMVGIKGQGMTALAEILSSNGAKVWGVDTHEVFYTDDILKKLGILFYEGFSTEHITPGIGAVIYSAAYNPETHVELKRARELSIPLMTYPQALGALSKQYDFAGISGVHGKTTTTAMAGTLVKYLNLPATVLAGSQIPTFDNRSALVQGHVYFIAETCEYKRHFLVYHPRRIILTSVELDHTDYFRDLEDMYDAFESYALLMPEEGVLIYHADEPGASLVAQRVKRKRADIRLIPYGKEAQGPYKVIDIRIKGLITEFTLAGFKESFSLRIPGEHSVYNATAALALVVDILNTGNHMEKTTALPLLHQALADFAGSKRRSEIIGTADGILFMDDYAHHPTAIYKTLKGIKDYYPDKRLVVDFMSHTYSRTKTLLKEFGSCFSPADIVILHKIYASAREKNIGDITGQDLAQEVALHHPQVHYFPELEDAVPYLKLLLKEHDIFITMGAGDNWHLSKNLFLEKHQGIRA